MSWMIFLRVHQKYNLILKSFYQLQQMVFLQWLAPRMDLCQFWKSMLQKSVISMTSLSSIVLFIKRPCAKSAGFAVVKIVAKSTLLYFIPCAKSLNFKTPWKKLIYNITSFFISVRYVGWTEERCQKEVLTSEKR